MSKGTPQTSQSSTGFLEVFFRCIKTRLKSMSITFKHLQMMLTHHPECQNGPNLTVVLLGPKAGPEGTPQTN